MFTVFTSGLGCLGFELRARTSPNGFTRSAGSFSAGIVVDIVHCGHTVSSRHTGDASTLPHSDLDQRLATIRLDERSPFRPLSSRLRDRCGGRGFTRADITSTDRCLVEDLLKRPRSEVPVRPVARPTPLVARQAILSTLDAASGDLRYFDIASKGIVQDMIPKLSGAHQAVVRLLLTRTP